MLSQTANIHDKPPEGTSRKNIKFNNFLSSQVMLITANIKKASTQDLIMIVSSIARRSSRNMPGAKFLLQQTRNVELLDAIVDHLCSTKAVENLNYR